MAVYDLGVRSEDFFDLTPAQFTALSERREEDAKYHDFRFGMIISTMINMFRGKKGRAVDALEVMGYGKQGKGKDAERVQSPEETALRFRLLQAAMKRGKTGSGK